VDAVSLPLGSEARPGRAQAALEQARQEGFAAAGFHAPGRGAGAAERAGLSAEGEAPEVTGRATWLLWAAWDEPSAVARLAELGLAPAVLVPGTAWLAAGGPWSGTHARHRMLDGGTEAADSGELLRRGAVRPGDSVWLHLDLRGRDWRRAALAVREAFLAAALQGLAGAAVQCPPPSREVDRQSVLWHLLRDAREEAAIVALALAQAEALRTAPLETPGLKLRRATVAQGARRLIGKDPEAALRLELRANGLEKVLRVSAGREFRGRPLSAFRSAKALAIELLGEMESLPVELPPTDSGGGRFRRVGGGRAAPPAAGGP
jgi:hypothetical protein